ncbi:hypothetical protein ACTXT7_006719 [Hymenolepis weldensis]
MGQRDKQDKEGHYSFQALSAPHNKLPLRHYDSDEFLPVVSGKKKGHNPLALDTSKFEAR